MRPNGPRLSCGALKNRVVIQYLTRAASFKRLLGGATQPAHIGLAPRCDTEAGNIDPP
jgi:hypothetical protein